jgi:hypothetical protein
MPSGAVLSWKMAADPGCIFNSHGQVPFLIQWSDMQEHPATSLSPENFLPYSLTFLGPDALTFESDLYKLGLVKSAHLSFVKEQTIQTVLQLSRKKNTLAFRAT